MQNIFNTINPSEKFEQVIEDKNKKIKKLRDEIADEEAGIRSLQDKEKTYKEIKLRMMSTKVTIEGIDNCDLGCIARQTDLQRLLEDILTYSEIPPDTIQQLIFSMPPEKIGLLRISVGQALCMYYKEFEKELSLDDQAKTELQKSDET